MKKLGETNATAGEKVKLKTFLSHAMKDLKVDATDGLLDLKDSALGAMNRMKGVFTGDSASSSSSSAHHHNTGSGAHGTSTRLSSSSHSGRNNDIEAASKENDDDDGNDNATNTHALVFKRHKVQMSPNILAEKELEESVYTTALPNLLPSTLTSRKLSGPNSAQKQHYTSLQTVPEEVSLDLSLSPSYADDNSSTVVNPIFTQFQQQQQQQQQPPSLSGSGQINTTNTNNNNNTTNATSSTTTAATTNSQSQRQPTQLFDEHDDIL